MQARKAALQASYYSLVLSVRALNWNQAQMREKELQLLEEDIACDLKIARAALRSALHRKEGLPAWSRSSKRAAPWPLPFSLSVLGCLWLGLPLRTEAEQKRVQDRQRAAAGDSCPNSRRTYAQLSSRAGAPCEHSNARRVDLLHWLLLEEEL